MGQKNSIRKNNFLHAANPRSSSSKDVMIEPPTKQTTYIEGGINNGLPFFKVGLKQEKYTINSPDEEEKVRRFLKMV